MYVYDNGEAVPLNMATSFITVSLAVGTILTLEEFEKRAHYRWVSETRELKLCIKSVEEYGKRLIGRWPMREEG